MPVFNNILAGAAGQVTGGGDAGFKIDRSLRFNDATLYRDFSAGHHLKWTWAGWVKRSKLGSNFIFQGGNTDYNDDGLLFNSYNKLQITFHNGSNAVNGQLITSAEYLDCSAWMHICLVSDSGNSVGNDRMRLFVNGLRITEFDTNNNPTVGTGSHDINKASRHHIGSFRGSSDYFSGMMADCYFLDGHLPATATDDASGSVTGTPNAEYLTDFGEFNATTGVWDPKEFTFPAAVKHKGDWIGDTTGTPYNTSDSSQIYTSFDGVSSTGSVAQTSSYITFTPSTAITGISKVRLRVQRDPQMYQAGDLQLNGTNIGDSWSTGQTATVEFNVNNLTSLKWGTASNNHWYRVYTIEIYYDGAYHHLEQADANNFHLDFADTSSSAALGTDSSGSNNTWTISNLVATAVNYNSTLTAVDTSETITNPGRAFDNSTSTSIGGIANGIKFTPPGGSQSNVTSLRFYSQSFGQGGRIKLNGSTVESNYDFGNGGWYSFSSSALSNISNTLTSFEWDRQPGQGSNNSDYLFGVEINGNVLVNTSAVDIDSLLDSPTNYVAGTSIGGNYCTLNPLSQSGGTFSEGGLSFVGPNSWASAFGTMAFTSGKWYYEVTLANAPFGQSEGNDHNGFGWGEYDTNDTTGPASVTTAVFLQETGWFKNYSGSRTNTSQTMAAGDVLSVAVDLDANTFEFKRNGTSVVSGTIGGTPGRQLAPYIISYNGTYGLMRFNFGQQPFSQSVPAGYSPLCTQVFDTPLIEKGADHFDILKYQGNGASSPGGSGSTQDFSTFAFAPGMVWIKDLEASNHNHNIADTVRGTPGLVLPDANDAEITNSTDGFTGFTDDGFTLGANSNGDQSLELNKLGNHIIAWAWKTASSNTSISAGGLNSSVYNTSSTWRSNWTASGNGFGSYPVSNIFDANLDNFMNNAAGGQYITWNTTSYTLSGELLIDVSSSSGGVYDIYVNGSKAADTTGTRQWVNCGTFADINEIQFAGTAYGTSNGLGSAGINVYGIKVGGKQLIDSDVTPANVPSLGGTVRANQTAGFSVIKSDQMSTGSLTLPHGLNRKPHMVMRKRLDASSNWYVSIDTSDIEGYMLLDTDAALTSQGVDLNENTFSVAYTGGTNEVWINYAFAPVPDFSAMGTYIGGGSDNVVVHTGFRPRFVMLKNTGTDNTTGAGWIMIDTERDIDNNCVNYLTADTTAAQGNTTVMDILSNGFRLTNPYTSTNGTGIKYFYYAVAESPFKYSRAR